MRLILTPKQLLVDDRKQSSNYQFIEMAPAVQRHSARRTLMRFTEAARRAGSNEASHARSSTKTAARVSASGSKGLRPNRKEPSSREGDAPVDAKCCQ